MIFWGSNSDQSLESAVWWPPLRPSMTAGPPPRTSAMKYEDNRLGVTESRGSRGRALLRLSLLL